MSYELPLAPFPSNVGVCFTKRQGGFSVAPYDSFNLGLHVGDDPLMVSKNRQQLCEDQQLESIIWLNQVHGIEVVEANRFSNNERNRPNLLPQADASYTSDTGTACAIMVADCLPVLVTNLNGTIVGAAHAGWRGLCSGVIPNLISNMAIDPKEALVWLGPCIGKEHFEVGRDVFDAFSMSQSFAGVDISSAFISDGEDHYLADLHALARLQLTSLGIHSVYTSNTCVYSNSKEYFSYRRENITGRMAALIWLKK